MAISWIHNNISDSIKKSILFVNSAADVWKLLEQRFQLTNGSRKYKLSKDLFNVKQNGSTLVEYYTSLSSIWEEIDVMTVLPVISFVSDEIRSFFKAIDVQKEESRLFQFLNGLDDCYAAQRSQILMFHPLPTVEMACSVIQQEESQRTALNNVGYEVTAMYNKIHTNSGTFNVCPECGRKGHGHDDCWRLIGYPKWHNKNKRTGSVSHNGNSSRPPEKWNLIKGGRMVNVA
ncbi:uncharacterized protein LOC141673262 [Apium graveolens]|uniref:uncharacterized protein LOC141673262 n=1 Tax=Apium graveolens TaxID=4045 RepID=UPI003D79B332